MAKVTKAQLYVQIGGLLAQLVGEEVPAAPKDSAKLAELQEYVNTLQAMVDARAAKLEAAPAPAPAPAPAATSNYNPRARAPQNAEEQQIEREFFRGLLTNGGVFPRQLIERGIWLSDGTLKTYIEYEDLFQSESGRAFLRVVAKHPKLNYDRTIGANHLACRIRMSYIMLDNQEAKILDRTRSGGVENWKSFQSSFEFVGDLMGRVFDEGGAAALESWASAEKNYDELRAEMLLTMTGRITFIVRMSRNPENGTVGESFINATNISGRAGKFAPSLSGLEGEMRGERKVILPKRSLVAGAQVNEGDFEAPISRPVDDGFEAPVAPHQFGKGDLPF